MKPLRIVHCANFNEHKLGAIFYATDRKVSNGLIRNGHFVQDFSYRTVARNSTFFKSKKLGAKNTNNALIECIKNIEADLLLLGHSELIYDETLLTIKDLFPQIKIGMWWVDWIHNLKNINLTNRLKIIDHFFITTDPCELKKVGIEDNYLKKCSYFPNMSDPSFDIYKAFENYDTRHDLLFMGRYDKDRKEFIDFLKENFSNTNLGLYGISKNTFLQSNEYLRTIASSKIGINYSRDNSMQLYSSGRIIQLTAAGVMVMSPEIPGFKKLFTDDEIIYFKDDQDFKDKCTYFLHHNEERIAIAKNGWEKAHNTFNNKKVTQFMVESILNKPLSENYAW